MSYKFVKVTSFYREFLTQLYAQNSSLKEQSYKDQKDAIMQECVSWSDFFPKHLKALDVEAHEIIFNADHLQAKWAEENNFSGSKKEIVLKQISELKPDVVMFQDSISFNGNWIRTLREKVPSIKIVIGWCCSPLPDRLLSEFSSFDFTIVCSPKFQQDFSTLGLKSYQVYHAFEDSLLPFIDKAKGDFDFDIIFVGSIFPGAGFHDKRLLILEQLLKENLNIAVYANIPRLTTRDLLLRQSSYVAAKSLSSVGLEKVVKSIHSLNKGLYHKSLPKNIRSEITKIVKAPLFGLDMLKAISKSRIGFNYHGEAAGDYAANIRMFEVTGVGSCLITDNKKNICELFEPDEEIVVYNSLEECLEKIKWLLNNPKECERIARAGQKKTLTHHTLKQRVEKINRIILENLK